MNFAVSLAVTNGSVIAGLAVSEFGMWAKKMLWYNFQARPVIADRAEPGSSDQQNNGFDKSR